MIGLATSRSSLWCCPDRLHCDSQCDSRNSAHQSLTHPCAAGVNRCTMPKTGSESMNITRCYAAEATKNLSADCRSTPNQHHSQQHTNALKSAPNPNSPKHARTDGSQTSTACGLPHSRNTSHSTPIPAADSHSVAGKGTCLVPCTPGPGAPPPVTSSSSLPPVVPPAAPPGPSTWPPLPPALPPARGPRL